jgi:tryptophanase
MYSIENTSDPHIVRVTVDHHIMDRGSQTFDSAAMAAFSPLASELFKVSGIRRVELGRNTIVLTKSTSSSWESVKSALEKTLASYFA